MGMWHSIAGCAIDLAALKIVSGKRCWVLFVDGLVLSADGNLLSALSIAVKVDSRPSKYPLPNHAGPCF